MSHGLDRVSPARVAGVTAGLSATGALLGASVGVSLLTIVELSIGGLFGNPFLLLELAATGAVGSLLGAVLLPVSTWALLRRIPLNRVLIGLTVGATVGATVGLIPTVATSNFTWAVAGGVAGLSAAVAWLRGIRVGSRRPA